eukprot:CAMPEP_0180514398 /NCGR_PEP_ID=MMETSP1036_2-20121128/52706_1 /TAXON_ID=632150 /ORGANISM="Azadinium spinosum, Strain 3D9" /LENGTH=56 /DNA_ID=CAMNT_0022525813 /DNA_START=166 /DNA_END=336 /DNA_ORIENTATION=-
MTVEPYTLVPVLMRSCQATTRMVADSAQPSFRLPIAAPTQGCLLTTRIPPSVAFPA